MSPIHLLLDALESLLTSGRADPHLYPCPALFPPDSSIPIIRGDADLATQAPLCAIAQIGPAAERHAPLSGLWDIPVSARLVLLARDDSQTIAEHQATLQSYATDLEGILTSALVIDPDGDPTDPENWSTPAQRLTTPTLTVHDIFKVFVEQDTEDNGDLVLELKLTAFCTVP
jgi:hypothetical protein